jgi:hypothetical protein
MLQQGMDNNKGQFDEVNISSLGEREICEAPRMLLGDLMDEDPVGVFIFKYRSLGIS